MDKREAIKIAKRYADIVSRHYNVKKVIMFGSYAKGTYREDSDIDLAIILNSVDDLFKIQVELMKLRTDDDLLIEPHPFDSSDFSPSDPTISEILKNGIEIIDYAA
ncbi:MAG: nucleotidyltransferase family protein [Bacteroidales bacterium]